MSILVVLEHRSGKFLRAALEALTAGQQTAQSLGVPLHAAVLGENLDALATESASYGVAKVFTLADPALANYTPDAYTLALEQLVKAITPSLILFPHTYQVRDYAPKLATRLGSMLVSDLVAIRVEAGKLVFVRQIFQGKLRMDVRPQGSGPAWASIQASTFSVPQSTGTAGTVESFAVTIDPAQIRSKPEEPFRAAARTVDLGAAEIIVAVGRGIKDESNIPIAKELADILGAELAASRPICDNGWLPMERQVGSSGQTVSPKVYIAVGISGAVQHLVGMKGSKTVIAINKDENAPIFENADYCVVGDLLEIVPELVKEIRKVKA